MSKIYVFDTNSFRVFGNYYPESFPSFWEQLDVFIDTERLTSCKEVIKELERQSPSEHLNSWVENHPALFTEPTGDEMIFVAEIFKIRHFRQLIGQKQQLIGAPVADPFLVARGEVLGGCVVSEESLMPNAARIPNVCQHFGIPCINVQRFLNEVGWRF